MTRAKKSQHHVSRPANYLAYLKKMKEVIREPEFDKIRESVKAKIELSKDVADMRIAELVMFNSAWFDRKKKWISFA